MENIPRNDNVGPPREDSKSNVTDLQCELEHFKDRIIFMSMYNDIGWKTKGNKEESEYTSQTVANYARRFPRGPLVFLGSWTGRKVVRNLH